MFIFEIWQYCPQNCRLNKHVLKFWVKLGGRFLRKLKKSISCLFTKNILLINFFCFWSDFDENWWDCSTHESWVQLTLFFNFLKTGSLNFAQNFRKYSFNLASSESGEKSKGFENFAYISHLFVYKTHLWT